MRPIIITGVAGALAAGWAAIITFVIPSSFMIKMAIALFGGLAIGVIVALVLVRQWFERRKAKEGGEQDGS